MSNPEKLQDFGEHIAGAKKETYFRAIDPTSEEAKTLPLSKLWIDKDIKAIEDIEIASIAHTLRDALPTRPRSPYKLNRWLDEVSKSQAIVVGLLEKNDPVFTEIVMREFEKTRNGNKAYLLTKLDREDWKKVGDVRFLQNTNENNSVYLSVQLKGERHSFYPKEPVTLANYDTRAMIDEFASDIQTILKDKDKNMATKEMTASSFDIYTYKKDNTAFICAKTDRQKTPLITFETLAEAREYKKDPENIAELSRRWTAHREQNSITKSDMRNAVNEERTGQSYRDHDITPDEFMATFGVRGGQFGNWVTGDERQQMLNNAYDGFMDLSKALKIDPKAIGLNGTLGIAFGARGSGWASAHYERGEQVINLTKTRGAGSLAHEWWHALDHYMKNGDGLLTRHLNANSTARHQELIAPVRELVKDIHKSELYSRSQKADAYRSQPYFSTDVEMTARAFEGHIQHTLSTMGIKNDFLVNIKAEKDWQKNLDAYPYPKAEELEPLGKAYNTVFDTLKEVDKEFVPVHYEPEQIIHADTLAVTGAEKTKESLEPIMKNQENNSLNIIAKDFSNDPASKEVQDRVMALAKQHPQELIKIYTEMSSTFNGRYIASDMMKEVFDDFNQSPAHRNQFNNAVHNSAATLSALHFEQMINEPVTDGRDTVVFLTGCPGAGKTSSVMNSNTLKQNVGIVFEGQLANAHQNPATIKKIQQALDKGFKVEIIAVNPLPEQALENTFKRYYDPNDGRGAPISTMARIQGNTYDGLKAIQDKFGDKVELHIVDKPDGNKNTIKYDGWQHLDVIKSQGTEADIAKRLENHLINHYSQGKIDYECFKQSAGSEERAKQLLGSRVVERDSESERENGNGREISSGSRQESHTQQGRNSSPVSQAHTHITNSQTKPNLSTQNTYINCPYAEKDQAKALGAKWDNANKSWYVPQGTDLSKFEKWLVPEKEKTTENPAITPTPQGKTYLYTTPSDNEAIQKLKVDGIVKFDLPNKVWYTLEPENPQVKQWLQPAHVPSAEEAFAEHLRANGISLDNGHPIADGRPHRLSNDGSNKKNVMYQLYRNDGGIPAGRITNFSRGGTPEKWVYPAEYIAVLKNIEAVNVAKGLAKPTPSIAHSSTEKTYPTQEQGQSPKIHSVSPEQQATYDKTASRVAMVMQFAPLAQQHEYLDRKQVTHNHIMRIVPDKSQLPPQFANDIVIANDWKEAQALRNQGDERMILQKGNLMIPQFNEQGELRSFETIGYQGAKYALKGGEKNGLSVTLGQAKNGQPIIIAEGYATGATLHEQTGRTVVVAFGKGGLLNIAQQVREHCPDSKIYIGADNDHAKTLEINPNTGKPHENVGLVDAQKVAEAVPNTHVLVPKFATGEQGKDWNDVYVNKGVDEFKRQLIEQLNHINPPKEQPNITQSEPTVQERLDSDFIKQSYPQMSDENLKAIQVWKEVITHSEKYAPETKEDLLKRLADHIPSYANGERLPLPTGYMEQQQDMGKQTAIDSQHQEHDKDDGGRQ